MAISTKIGFSILLFLLLSSFSDAHSFRSCMFDQIYQFGDSISDTGNLVRENLHTPFSHHPYGMSFFDNATGRCSNGLLMIDYIALDAGVPLLNPYLNKHASTNHGVNFAVAGSTALSFETLLRKNISSTVTNSSLDHQLDWMSSQLESICGNKKGCPEKLRNALFLVGEIGGNDYNYALIEGKPFQEIKNLVSEVVQTIKRAVMRVISYGATRIIVPGNLPIGCLPIYLTLFQTNDTSAYDELGCLKEVNNLSVYHNDQIKQVIEVLKKENPHTVIVYGDYYNALLSILQHASMLGFNEDSLQKSCCGIGGKYNFDLKKSCGLPEVPVCPNPNNHVSWDGVHPTQNTYKFMAEWLSHDIFPNLHCNV